MAAQARGRFACPSRKKRENALSALWTRDAAADVTGGKSARDWTASGVSIDTRSLAPGDLFVALSAARDGHDFVAEALAQGAAAAMVARVPAGVPKDAPLLLVPDVLDGLVEPGRVFDRIIGLDETPAGYRAMAERAALKVLVCP